MVATLGVDLDLCAGSALRDRLQSDRPCVINSAEPPFEVLGLNSAWSQLCGYTPEEALGKDPKQLLHGEQTDRTKTKEFTARLQAEGEARTTVVNYSRGGRPFLHRLHTSRVVDPTSGTSYYVTASDEVVDPALVSTIHDRRSLLRRPEQLRLTLGWAVEILLSLWCLSVAFGSPEEPPSELPVILFPLSVFDEGMMMFY